MDHTEKDLYKKFDRLEHQVCCLRAEIPGGGTPLTRISYIAAQALITSNSLVPGGLYQIYDLCDPTIEIQLTATDVNSFSLHGEGRFLNCDYQNVGDYSGVLALTGVPKGIDNLGTWMPYMSTVRLEYSGATSTFIVGNTLEETTNNALGVVVEDGGTYVIVTTITPTNIFVSGNTIVEANTGTTAILGTVTYHPVQIATGDIVFYDSVHYQCINSSLITNDNPSVRVIAWKVLPRSFPSTLGYIEEWDFIEYDLVANMLVCREDKRGNRITLDKSVTENCNISSYFQFGNSEVINNYIVGECYIANSFGMLSSFYNNRVINTAFSDNLFGYTTSIIGNEFINSTFSVNSFWVYDDRNTGYTISYNTFTLVEFTNNTFNTPIWIYHNTFKGTFQSNISSRALDISSINLKENLFLYNFTQNTINGGADIYNNTFGDSFYLNTFLVEASFSDNTINIDTMDRYAIENTIFSLNSSANTLTNTNLNGDYSTCPSFIGNDIRCGSMINNVVGTGDISYNRFYGDIFENNVFPDISFDNNIIYTQSVASVTFVGEVLRNTFSINIPSITTVTFTGSLYECMFESNFDYHTIGLAVSKYITPTYSSFEFTEDITGLTTIDMSDSNANNFFGIRNLTSTNATQNISHIDFGLGNKLPVRFQPEVGLSVTFTGTAIALGTTTSIALPTATKVVDGSKGEWVVFEYSPLGAIVKESSGSLI